MFKIYYIKMQSRLDIKCKANYTKNVKLTIQVLKYIRRCESMKTRISQLRKERKVTQEELALAVGVTRQTITSIEREKYTASLVLAYKIAKYFDLAIEEVFDFSEVGD